MTEGNSFTTNEDPEYYMRGCKIVGGPYHGTFLRLDVRRERIKLADPLGPLRPINAYKGPYKSVTRLYRRVLFTNGACVDTYEYHLEDGILSRLKSKIGD